MRQHHLLPSMRGDHVGQTRLLEESAGSDSQLGDSRLSPRLAPQLIVPVFTDGKPDWEPGWGSCSGLGCLAGLRGRPSCSERSTAASRGRRRRSMPSPWRQISLRTLWKSGDAVSGMIKVAAACSDFCEIACCRGLWLSCLCVLLLCLLNQS